MAESRAKGGHGGVGVGAQQGLERDGGWEPGSGSVRVATTRWLQSPGRRNRRRDVRDAGAVQQRCEEAEDGHRQSC